MNELLNKIAVCVERGKVNVKSPYPPDLKGQEGVDELTKAALDAGISAQDLLEQGLIEGMKAIGARFRRDEVFVPDVLMAAKAMKTGMAHIRPYFQSGEVKRRGTFIIGTVAGDMHDIGKNLVRMMIEAKGFEVVDLGVDVSAESFLKTAQEGQFDIVCLSALLTTTMNEMRNVVNVFEEAGARDSVKIMIGGAPITHSFCTTIGADRYTPDAGSAAEVALELITQKAA